VQQTKEESDAGEDSDFVVVINDEFMAGHDFGGHDEGEEYENGGGDDDDAYPEWKRETDRQSYLNSERKQEPRAAPYVEWRIPLGRSSCESQTLSYGTSAARLLDDSQSDSLR